jgi:hypothetical protein
MTSSILTCANCGSSACGASLATVSERQAAAKAAIAAGAGKVVKEKFRAAFRNLPNIAVK